MIWSTNWRGLTSFAKARECLGRRDRVCCRKSQTEQDHMCHLIGCRIEDLLQGGIYRTIQVIHRKIIGLDTRSSQAILHRMPVKLLLAVLKPNQEIDSTHLKGQTVIWEIGLRTNLRAPHLTALANSVMQVEARKVAVQVMDQLATVYTAHLVVCGNQGIAVVIKHHHHSHTQQNRAITEWGVSLLLVVLKTQMADRWDQDSQSQTQDLEHKNMLTNCSNRRESRETGSKHEPVLAVDKVMVEIVAWNRTQVKGSKEAHTVLRSLAWKQQALRISKYQVTIRVQA